MVTLGTWFNPEGIPNIISIPTLEKSGYCITYTLKKNGPYTPLKGEITNSIATLYSAKGYFMWN